MGKPVKKPGVCRVKGCRFYGKKMANWEAHVLETHKLKMTLHEGLAACSKKEMKDAHSDSKYRQPRPCLYPGCKKRNSLYMRLNRHLPQHGLSEKRYQLILNMMKAQGKFIKQTKGEIKTSFYDFCPAIQDSYPGHEVD
ncbi:uncharacterized protein [Amphiura filiformis]|uniref:uncharacterized protein n=1 Tax=Amphiura filiformis TaxID=82378 RepID=UPI003B214A40